MIWKYAYSNTGPTLSFEGTDYVSKRGLLDLLERNTQNQDIRYPIIFLKGKDIEVAISHGEQYGEEHYSFVNGQHLQWAAATNGTPGRCCQGCESTSKKTTKRPISARG